MTRQPGSARVIPLVLATMTSQALLVVLSPTITAIGTELRVPVAAVGQARTVTAAVGVTASLLLTARIAAIGVPRLLRVGSALAVLASVAVAFAQTMPLFLLAHVLVGVALAALLTGGFAGVAAFEPAARAWAMGYVAGANALAWIVVNPIAGEVTEWYSWRPAHAVPAGLALITLLAARSVAAQAQAPQRLPLRTLVGDRDARRWMLAELLAYACWAGMLTFVGAYFIEVVGVGEASAGWLLAAGAAAFFVASTRSGWLAARVPRRRLVATAAAAMAVLGPALLSLEPGVGLAAVIFCLIGLAAGVRTPAAGGIGLELLPGHAGAMMAVRTAVTQCGYLLGAAVGGAVIAVGGYPAVGVVVAAGMAVSGVLILRVSERIPAS